MYVGVLETGHSIKETANGFELRKYRRSTLCFTEDTGFELALVLSRENTILETVAFSGSFRSTVMDIKKAFKSPVDVFLNDSGTICMLDDVDMPFNRVFEVHEGELVPSYRVSIVVRPRHRSAEILKGLQSLQLLRRLVIQNSRVPRISLQILTRLKYLRLSNISLESIVPPQHPLEYCNLSRNCLQECSVRAKMLVVSHNKIKAFRSSFAFKHLDVSNNPLASVLCSADFLCIRNTCLKHVLHSNARTIVADGTKSIRLGSCPRLVCLSINDCGLAYASFSVSRLRILKARNNYFQVLPRLRSCLVASLSGNFLSSIDARKVHALDISKNQFVSLELNRLKGLKHLDLSFNPLDPSLRDNADGLPATVVLNDSQSWYFDGFRSRKVSSHSCSGKSPWCMMYRLQATIKESSVTMFVMTQTRTNRRYCELLEEILDTLKNDTSWLSVLSRFSDQVYLRISQEQPYAKMSFILITSRIVMVRNFGMESVVLNFAEVESVHDPDIIRVFNNVSTWSIVPVLCHSRPVSNKRRYALLSGGRDLVEIFQFLGHCCPRSAEFLVTGSGEFFNQQMQITSKCVLIKEISREYNRDFADVIGSSDAKSTLASSELLGIENVDFSLSMLRGGAAAPVFITSANPIFLFMKIVLGPGKDPVLEHEKHNLMGIFDFYCKVFGGRLIEKSYKLYIAGFDTPIQSAFWALRIQKILKAVCIDVCVGISSDVVFRIEEDGVVHFGGPALNKASRISDLGIGVFCCKCIKLNHPLIELVDEGERLLKGFDGRHRIFSLRLAGSY